MFARHHCPGAPLARFVDCLWLFDGYCATHTRERALPTGTVELVINLRDDRIHTFRSETDFTGRHFRGAVVCGPHANYFVLDPSQQKSVIGVHFRPGGAAPFLGAPGAEFAGLHVGLDDVWGPGAARTLRQRVLEAVTPAAKFAVLEESLLARLRRSLLPHPAVDYAIAQWNTAPTLPGIEQLRRETGYSPKRFIEMFRNSVGLTPKVYARIRRFQTVIDQLSRGRRVEWAKVALDSGYYDQPHLNREFRAFAGVSPTAYRPVGVDRPNHTFID